MCTSFTAYTVLTWSPVPSSEHHIHMLSLKHLIPKQYAWIFSSGKAFRTLLVSWWGLRYCSFGYASKPKVNFAWVMNNFRFKGVRNSLLDYINHSFCPTLFTSAATHCFKLHVWVSLLVHGYSWQNNQFSFQLVTYGRFLTALGVIPG